MTPEEEDYWRQEQETWDKLTKQHQEDLIEERRAWMKAIPPSQKEWTKGSDRNFFKGMSFEEWLIAIPEVEKGWTEKDDEAFNREVRGKR